MQLSLLRTSLLLLCLNLALAAGDWPWFRGARLDGRASDGRLEEAPGIAFETLWRTTIGAGYAGISIAGGRAFTQGIRDNSSYLYAVSTEDGRELWRVRLAEAYFGHDGSGDGPISTPAVHQGRVFALEPYGSLAAADAESGRIQWRKHLVEDLGGEAPYYGYANSPIVVGRHLIVLSGNTREGSVTALDPATGEVRWQSYPSANSYQTPLLAEAGGRTQLLVPSQKGLAGVDPQTGQVLWQHEYERPAEAPHVVAAERGRFLATRFDHALLYEVQSAEDGFELREIWSTRNLKNSYGVPVFHQGHFYGYSGRFLTCVRASDGGTAWKSRAPGGRGMLLLDGHLFILARGALVAAEAHSEAYNEKGRRTIFPLQDTWTPPSFADGVIYVRDMNEIAAVRPARTEGALRVEADQPDERWLQGDFGDFLRRLGQAEDKGALLDAFFERRAAFPIVEDNSVAHFVFRGEVPDLAIRGDMTRHVQEHPMHRVPGTDFYHRSYPVGPNARWQYVFRVFDESRPDPLNQQRVETPDGEKSVLRMPGWEEPTHVKQPPEDRAGTIERLELRSEVLERDYEVHVRLPPEYRSEADRRFPFILALHPEAMEFGKLGNTLANLEADGFEPAILAVLEVRPIAWAMWYLRRTDLKALRFLSEDLMPELERRYRLADPSRRLVLGQSGTAPGALLAALTLPERFGHAALQSPLLSVDEVREDVSPLLPQGASSARVHIDYGRYDFSSQPVSPFDVGEGAQALAAMLEGKGFEVRLEETEGGHNWASWSSQSRKWLEFLLGGE